MKNETQKMWLVVILVLTIVALLVSSCKKNETTNDDPTSGNIVKLSTSEVKNITNTTAECGGTIDDDGNRSILAKGLCWGTSTNPTIENNNTTNNGTGSESFTSILTGLSKGTTYYVRAYVTTNDGASYGDEKTFTTLDATLQVTTLEVSDVTVNSAVCNSEINESYTIIKRGICWSTSPDPTIEDNSTDDGSGAGSYTSNLSGLESKTIYYVRAYATTEEEGTVYGNQIEFRTSFKVGDIGPAGGYVFYDKGDTTGGWRYLEAAPKGILNESIWGCVGIYLNKSKEVGFGEQTTYDIIFNNNNCSVAVAKCVDHVVLKDGKLYDDWFLPSLDELILLHDNIFMKGLGSFNNGNNYFSSSALGQYDVWVLDFVKIQGGKSVMYPRSVDKAYIYPIRSFK